MKRKKHFKKLAMMGLTGSLLLSSSSEADEVQCGRIFTYGNNTPRSKGSNSHAMHPTDAIALENTIHAMNAKGSMHHVLHASDAIAMENTKQAMKDSKDSMDMMNMDSEGPCGAPPPPPKKIGNGKKKPKEDLNNSKYQGYSATGTGETDLDSADERNMNQYRNSNKQLENDNSYDPYDNEMPKRAPKKTISENPIPRRHQSWQ